MRRRPSITPPQSARRFVDAALADLRASRWSPRGWKRFLGASVERSWEDARSRRCALAEVTALHLLAAAWRPRAWLLGSWVMAATHLGLLGDTPRCLGWANRVTLLRAALPAVVPGAPAWTGLAALATDLVDGEIARRTGDATAFGGYADALADIAFWTRYVHEHEDGEALRRLCLAVWTVPAIAVTVAYVLRGRSVDYPRPVGLRDLSVSLQVLVALRAVSAGSGRRRPPHPRGWPRRRG